MRRGRIPECAIGAVFCHWQRAQCRGFVGAVLRNLIVVMVVLAPSEVMAQKWQDATNTCMGTTAQWTNKVEVADVDGDGKVDLLLANGGNYNSAGTAEATRVFKNTWGSTASCTEISAEAVAGFTGLSRMIKAADIDNDGDLDLLTGGAYQTQLRLFKRDGTTWTDATAQLPQQMTSIGDAEFGDVDNDGDLDLVLAEWGTGNPQTNTGGRTRLYLNELGTFTEATNAQMPTELVRWSWDIELADVDNDWDLDVLVACKSGSTSFLFRNDGTGRFVNDGAALPHFANNYELEPMDIDGDGDLDLVTINDGPNVTEHIFVNRGDGTYTDETAMRLTGTANPAGADDNVAVWLDYDNDGDPDLVIGSLGADRLLANDGSGKFTLVAGATPNDTNATLGLAAADFDGDGRIDLLQGQGEITNSLADKVQLASSEVQIDTLPPVVQVRTDMVGNIVYARVHDSIGPSHVHDFGKLVVMSGVKEIPMTWSGGMLWRASIPIEALAASYEVCATDRRGNKACASTAAVPEGTPSDDVPGANPPGGGGGCCDTRSDARGGLVLCALVALAWCRRRRR